MLVRFYLNYNLPTYEAAFYSSTTNVYLRACSIFALFYNYCFTPYAVCPETHELSQKCQLQATRFQQEAISNLVPLSDINLLRA